MPDSSITDTQERIDPHPRTDQGFPKLNYGEQMLGLITLSAAWLYA